jgi:ribosomal protein S18 acetylase RimI-like enzyme
VVVDGRIVAYIGFTAFLGWGHIDRVAVEPSFQGQGLGLRLTRFATDRLVRLGARRIGLSTQVSNEPARRMYEKLGFVRQLATDYRLYGRWLDERSERQRST